MGSSVGSVSRRAQAGCLLGTRHETQVHGLAAVLGFVSADRCAGDTRRRLRHLTRRFGWTDNLVSIDLVTAAGRPVRASARENSDLFWGLCGGGGNFGVATSFEYALHPVGPDVVAGAMAWRGEEAADVLEMYRAVMASAPRELTCVAGLRLAPPAPWIAKDVHGKPIVALFVCYSGSLADASAVARSGLRGTVGDPQKRPVRLRKQSCSRTSEAAYLDPIPRAIEPDVTARAIEHAARIVSPHSAILIFPVGGALNERPEDYSAVGNRDASAVLNISSAWDHARDDAQNIEWARETWRDMRRFSTGGTYINFLTEDEGDDRTRAAYRTNYERLAQVKAAWDPTNLFRTNKNIGVAR